MITTGQCQFKRKLKETDFATELYKYVSVHKEMVLKEARTVSVCSRHLLHTSLRALNLSVAFICTFTFTECLDQWTVTYKVIFSSDIRLGMLFTSVTE